MEHTPRQARFSGPWREDEKARVLEAIKAFEARAEDAPLELGEPWTCCCEMCAGRRFMVAMRMPGAHVMAAWNADDLAAKITTEEM